MTDCYQRQFSIVTSFNSTFAIGWLPRRGSQIFSSKNYKNFEIEFEFMSIVIQPQENLDQRAATALRVKLSKLAQTQHSRWLIDLSKVKAVGNVGLVTLVEADKFAKKTGRRLSLYNLRESVQYILAITELDRQLDILDRYEDVGVAAEKVAV
ncbi:MAG: STAS domain-containing protein [Geitlerinemataceae cyanobacterium]